MRAFGGVIAISALLSLAACEKKFDDKYEENLEELNKEAKTIKAQADDQLAIGQEADEAMEKAEGNDDPVPETSK